jgi:hypothetical protein
MRYCRGCCSMLVHRSLTACPSSLLCCSINACTCAIHDLALALLTLPGMIFTASCMMHNHGINTNYTAMYTLTQLVDCPLAHL